MRDCDVVKVIPLSKPIPYVYKDEKGNDVFDELKEVKIGVIKGKHLEYLPTSIMNATIGPGGGKRRKININPAEFLPLIAAVTELPIATVKEMVLLDILAVASELTDSITLPE